MRSSRVITTRATRGLICVLALFHRTVFDLLRPTFNTLEHLPDKVAILAGDLLPVYGTLCRIRRPAQLIR
jgi:hypothetical protein